MKYIAIAAIMLPADTVLGLTEAQAASRKHALTPTARKGWYTTTAPVQFKCGEEILYDGDLPKGTADNLTAKEKAEAEARDAAKAADKLKARAAAEAKAEAAKAREKAEPEARAAWAKDEALRTQHGDDFEAYLASVLQAG